MNIIASAILATTVGFTGSVCDYSMNFENGLLVSVDEEAHSNYVIRVERQQAELNETKKLVEMLWSVHTNRIARIEARHANVKTSKSAVERVKENAEKRKRRSVMPKNAGGVK